jgi:hypothetical protein
MKKLLSCLLAAAVLLAPTAAAGAQNGEAADGDAYAAEAVATEYIVNVAVPSSLDFTIDPFEIADKGQVYSGVYSVRNRGDTDVLLTFTETAVIFASDTDFEALPEPFDENNASDRKAIYLLLDFGREDVAPVILTDADAALAQILLTVADDGESTCTLSLSGSVNPYPAEDWRDGDVRIRLNYRLEALQPMAVEGLETMTMGEDEEETVIPENGLPEITYETTGERLNEDAIPDDIEADVETPSADMTQTSEEDSPAGELDQTPGNGDEESPAADITQSNEEPPAEPDQTPGNDEESPAEPEPAADAEENPLQPEPSVPGNEEMDSGIKPE